MQGTGVLFNRNTALEFDRRKSIVAVLETQQEICRMWAAAFSSKPDECSPDLESLQTTCREAGNLDFIIMQSGLKSPVTAEWTFADPELQSDRQFRLYDCKRLIGG